MCPRHRWCAYGGPSTSPTARALASWRGALWGWRDGVHEGGCLAPLLGASEVRRSSSPGCPAARQAVRVRYPRAVGASLRVWGASTVPLAGMLCGELRAARTMGGRSGGRWPSTIGSGVRCQALSLSRLPISGGVHGGGALHRSEGHLRSRARPPPAARLPGGLSGCTTHVLWARACGLGGPALSLWLACPARGCMPRAGQRPFRGGMAFHRCQGRVVSGAVPLHGDHAWGRPWAGAIIPICT